MDSHGSVYVADTGNDVIEKFNSNGEYLGSLRIIWIHILASSIRPQASP